MKNMLKQEYCRLQISLVDEPSRCVLWLERGCHFSTRFHLLRDSCYGIPLMLRSTLFPSHFQLESLVEILIDEFHTCDVNGYHQFKSSMIYIQIVVEKVHQMSVNRNGHLPSVHQFSEYQTGLSSSPVFQNMLR